MMKRRCIKGLLDKCQTTSTASSFPSYSEDIVAYKRNLVRWSVIRQPSFSDQDYIIIITSGQISLVPNFVYDGSAIKKNQRDTVIGI